MCPACISTAAAALATGVVSSGGMAALCWWRSVVAHPLDGLRPGAGHLHNSTRHRETIMEQPRIVTRDEWVAARKELLVKEKAVDPTRTTRSPPSGGKLPMVKVDKAYVRSTRLPGRQADAGRAVRRPQPAPHVPLHVRAGLGRGLPELLLPGPTSTTAPSVASRAPRRHVPGRARGRRRRTYSHVPASAWAGDIPLGFVERQRLPTSDFGVSFTQ